MQFTAKCDSSDRKIQSNKIQRWKFCELATDLSKAVDGLLHDLLIARLTNPRILRRIIKTNLLLINEQ